MQSRAVHVRKFSEFQENSWQQVVVTEAMVHCYCLLGVYSRAILFHNVRMEVWFVHFLQGFVTSTSHGETVGTNICSSLG